jgi:hypothetical protein
MLGERAHVLPAHALADRRPDGDAHASYTFAQHAELPGEEPPDGLVEAPLGPEPLRALLDTASSYRSSSRKPRLFLLLSPEFSGGDCAR